MSKNDETAKDSIKEMYKDPRDLTMVEKRERIRLLYQEYISELTLQKLKVIYEVFTATAIKPFNGFKELVEALQSLNGKIDEERAKLITDKVKQLHQYFEEALEESSDIFYEAQGQDFFPEDHIREGYLMSLLDQHGILYQLLEKDPFLIIEMREKFEEVARLDISDSGSAHNFNWESIVFNKWLSDPKLLNFELKAPLEVILPTSSEAKDPVEGESILEAKYNARNSVNSIIHKVQQLNKNANPEQVNHFVLEEESADSELLQYLSTRQTETKTSAEEPQSLREAVLAQLQLADQETTDAREAQPDFLDAFIAESREQSHTPEVEVESTQKYYNLVFIDKKHSGGQINIREDYFYDFVKGTSEEGLLYKINLISKDDATANGAPLFADANSITEVFTAVKEIASRLAEKIKLEQEIAAQRSQSQPEISTVSKQPTAEYQKELATEEVEQTTEQVYAGANDDLQEGFVSAEDLGYKPPQEKSNIDPETLSAIDISGMSSLYEESAHQLAEEYHKENDLILQALVEKLNIDVDSISEQELRELKEALEDPFAVRKEFDKLRENNEQKLQAEALGDNNSETSKGKTATANLGDLSLHASYNLNANRGFYNSHLSQSVAETTLTEEDLVRLEQEIASLPKPTRNLVQFFMSGGRMREFDKLANLLKSSVSFELYKLLFKKIETRQMNEGAKNKERELSVYVLENRYFPTDDFKIEGFQEFFRLAKTDNYHQIFAPQVPAAVDPREKEKASSGKVTNSKKSGSKTKTATAKTKKATVTDLQAEQLISQEENNLVLEAKAEISNSKSAPREELEVATISEVVADNSVQVSDKTELATVAEAEVNEETLAPEPQKPVKKSKKEKPKPKPRTISSKEDLEALDNRTFGNSELTKGKSLFDAIPKIQNFEKIAATENQPENQTLTQSESKPKRKTRSKKEVEQEPEVKTSVTTKSRSTSGKKKTEAITTADPNSLMNIIGSSSKKTSATKPKTSSDTPKASAKKTVKPLEDKVTAQDKSSVKKKSPTKETAGKKLKLAEVKNLLRFLQKQEANFSKNFPQLASELKDLAILDASDKEQVTHEIGKILNLVKHLFNSLESLLQTNLQQLENVKQEFTSAKQNKDKELLLALKAQGDKLLAQGKKYKAIINKLLSLAPSLKSYFSRSSENKS